MKASKEWGYCSCECGNKIMPGDEMVNVDGFLFLAGHEENKRTRFTKTIKKEKKPTYKPNDNVEK